MPEPMTEARLEEIRGIAALKDHAGWAGLCLALRDSVAEIDRLKADNEAAIRTYKRGPIIPPKGGSGTAPVKQKFQTQEERIRDAPFEGVKRELMFQWARADAFDPHVQLFRSDFEKERFVEEVCKESVKQVKREIKQEMEKSDAIL